VQIIRQSSFRTTPWKNGGGVTHEAVRVPADGAIFHWRVSVATIAASGPFSDFSGYRRCMVLLAGAGVELRFADGTRASLREVGALIAFDGGLAAHCELWAGECTDLNLMVSAALPAPRVRVLRLTGALANLRDRRSGRGRPCRRRPGNPGTLGPGARDDGRGWCRQFDFGGRTLAGTGVCRQLE